MSGLAERALDEPTLLRHEGVPFSGPNGFLVTALSLVRRSADAGQACLLLAAPQQLRAAREQLDALPISPSFLDITVQGRNPARILPALESFRAGHPDREVCVVAEPLPVGQTPALRAEAELGEWILASPHCRQWPAAIWCLYDGDALDSAGQASIAHVHREDLAPDEPEQQLRKRFREPLPAPPRNARACAADLTTLGELRRTVGRFAGAAGLDEERIDDLVYAVNEVVTNSICHGEGRARVLLWAETDAVWCQVQDRGRITDPLIGRIAPASGRAGGRGLWLVNQLCDLVQVRSSEPGTTVRLSVDF